MPELAFPLLMILRKLEEELLLAEALFVPEISTLDNSSEVVSGVLRRLSNELLESRPLVELWRRHAPPATVTETLSLEVSPLRRQAAWSNPVTLKLPLVRWQQTPTMHVAYLPTLGIEVIGETAEEVTERLAAHSHSTLLRTGMGTSLRQLSMLQRCTEIEIVADAGKIHVLSPKERAKQAVDEEDRLAAGHSTLRQVATDLTDFVHHSVRELIALDDHAARVAELLTGMPRRSVLLVGPPGVGKTAIVQAMLQGRVTFGLGDTPFWATTGSRLVAGMSGFGMWEERCQKLCKEVAKLKAVLHLGNLVELLEVGRSEFRSQGIASFLRPRILRGELVAIAECTPEQFALVEREEPQLLAAFASVTIAEPDEEQTRSIVTQFAARRSGKSVSVSTEVVDKLLSLHRRYATYSARPGRPLRFVKSLFSDQYKRFSPGIKVDPRDITMADVTRAFSAETGLPLWLIEESSQLDLEKTRAWFTERVVGQQQAVELVIDLIATVKARLMRPRRPLASLLFIGPTGVGKTELAKSLAEFFFSNSQRLTRFDMSEYSDPLAVQRLIGGAFGAEGLLTAKVREQPFAVLLFDEFEKADPLFFDLLLQVLGDARLTDGAGRVADFSNAVIVLTSNLGAASYLRGTAGFTSDEASSTRVQEHFTLELRQFVRPELFNRFDRIVPFDSLTEESTRHIVRRQLELLRQRDGLRYRDVELQVDDTVVPHLARLGYDRRYGARPLKRAIERELLVPLSENLNGYAVELPLLASIRVEQERLICDVSTRRDDSGRPRSLAAGARQDVELAESFLALRRATQRLQQCPAMLELRNTIFQLQRRQDRIVDYQHTPTEDDRRQLDQLSRLREREFAVDELQRRVVAATESVQVELYSNRVVDGALYREELATLHEAFESGLLQLYLRQFPEPNAVTLTILSEDGPVIQWLGKAYFTAAEAVGGRVRLWSLWPARPLTDECESPRSIPWDSAIQSEFTWQLRDAAELSTWTLNWQRDALPSVEWLERRLIEEPNAFFGQPFEPGLLGVILEIEGPAVTPRFTAECGWYRWLNRQSQRHALVEAESGSINRYLPPFGIERRGSLTPEDIRRIYDEENGWILESLTKRKSPWSRGQLGAAIAEILERRLHEIVRSLIDDAD